MSYGTPPPPPPPSEPGYGQPAGYGAAPAGTNKKAIWSLVLGILGLVCCGFFTGIPAIILSRSAKKEIASSGQSGGGMATAGQVLGWIAVAFGVIFVILALTGNVDFSGNVSTS
jgi:hypothetical protein